MELRQLEYFLAVSELKSFTKAAEKFYVSQPAVTNAISSLEKELNTRLFVRSNRHFSLTTEGEVFYNYIKLVFKDVNVALSQLDHVKNKKKNILKLAVCSCMSERVILPAYREFSRKHPDARSLSDWPPKLRLMSAIGSGVHNFRIRKRHFQRSGG